MGKKIKRSNAPPAPNESNRFSLEGVFQVKSFSQRTNDIQILILFLLTQESCPDPGLLEIDFDRAIQDRVDANRPAKQGMEVVARSHHDELTGLRLCGYPFCSKTEETDVTTFLSITKSQMMALKLFRMNAVTIVNVTTLAFLMVMTVGSSSALAQVLDPSLEVFRIRCQIDADVNPATGVLEPKVQIQGKARADLLDGAAVDFGVQNLTTTTSLPPNVVSTVFELGSATADWDTFPDATDPTPVTTDSPPEYGSQ